MAFTQASTANTKNKVGIWTEAKALPSSATIGYSAEIDFLEIDREKEHKYVTFVASASAVTGTNVDIALYGAATSGGTKFLLLDAVVADLDNSNKVKSGTIDINAYPAPFYYLGHTADVDEHLNTITYTICQ